MIEQLVADLPEIYQPIYGHPELSTQVSRTSTDRLDHIVRIHDNLQALLDRPLKVLDLGCAQGFFSLNLAEHGAYVHGVDYLDRNIVVCNALAQAHPKLHVSFEMGRVEDVIESLEPDCYDLILGLSVFHHIIHEKGIVAVKELIEHAVSLSGALVVELALREEPLYWGPSQPEDPRALLDTVAFSHELARHATHLAPIARPLFVVSNRYCIISDQAFIFESWSTESHRLSNGTHEGSRRYFFGTNSILKMYQFDCPRGDHNKAEFKQEIQFLQNPPTEFPTPTLLVYGENKVGAWVVSQRIPGRLLIDFLQEGMPIDHHKVILAILTQLSTLEKAGLYHNDVRIWNVLITEDGSSRLIDYGAISTKKLDGTWPSNLFLSFLIFVREVSTGVVDPPNLSGLPRTVLSGLPRTVSISPYGLPDPYCAWAIALWYRPLAEWSFELMHNTLLDMPENGQNHPVQRPAEAWMKATEEAIQALKLHTYYQIDIHRAVIAQTSERAGEAQYLALQANTRAEQAEASAAQANTRAEQAEASAAQANTRAEQAEASAAQANTCAEQAQAAAHHAAMRYQTIVNSRTWHMTAPLRWVMDKVKWFMRGSAAWITLRPGSRPRRTARMALLHLRNWVLKRPRAKARVLRILRRFPRLKLRLKRLHHANPIRGVHPAAPFIAGDVPIEEHLKHLSPRARKIYADLKSAMARQQQQGSN